METSPLNNNQKKQLAALEVTGQQLLTNFGGDEKNFLTQIDTSYTNWLNTEKNNQKLNTGLNSFGVLFGNYLKEKIVGLEWKFITDEYGTELGLYREKNDVVLFPINLVVKRYSNKEVGFFEKLTQNILTDLTE